MTYESSQEGLLRKRPGLVSEIYLGGVKWGLKEVPSTAGVPFATIYSSHSQFARLLRSKTCHKQTGMVRFRPMHVLSYH